MRCTILLVAITLAASALWAQRPVPQMPLAPIVPVDGVDGLAPMLLETAKRQVDGQDWVAHALSGGATLREQSQIIVEFSANGRYTLFHEGQKVGVERQFDAGFKEGLAIRFPGTQIVPTESRTMFRAWLAPGIVASFFEVVREHYPDATAAPWRAPETSMYGFVNTEGATVDRMYTEWYNAVGVTGTGVRIAVLDLGFKGIDTTASAEVGPYSRMAAQNNLNADTTAHGTAVCEIIRDVAPGCELRVYRLDAFLDVATATSDALAWGADIISASLLWSELPLEGPACASANMALSAGATWVNAAGNYADGAYWESNSVGLMSLAGQTYVDYDPPFGDPYQSVSGTVNGASLRAFFAYEAPNASYARFALELWRWDTVSQTLTLVASGTAGATTQWVEHTTWGSSYSYHLLLRRTQTGTIGRMRQFVHGDYANSFYFSSSRGSVSNPGSVPGVITVGAVHRNNYANWGLPEIYSSRGGGLWNLPLDLCGPTAVSTASYGQFGFTGTSAAAPHVAGLLALQFSDPGLAADPFNQLWFRDQGPVGWDPDSGMGAVLAFVDGQEPDNVPAAARNLGSSSTTATGHMISPGVDVDWFRFSLATPQFITLETSGVAGGDTVLTLYNGALATIATDDDGGFDLYSRLYAGQLGAGTWYVKVESWNNSSVISAYSLALTVTSVGPPGLVALQSPAQGAAGLALPVVLQWSAASGPGTITYRCQVATDSGFTAIVHDQQGIVGLSHSPSLSVGASYHWRVQASSQYGVGGWSAAREFSTLNPAPGQPTLLEPAHGATGVPASPWYEWDVPASGTGPFTYELSIAQDPGFTGWTYSASGISAAQAVGPLLQAGSTYYWRVRASNAAGSGPWSMESSFQVSPAPAPAVGSSRKSGSGCAVGTGSALPALVLLLAWRRARRRHWRARGS